MNRHQLREEREKKPITAILKSLTLILAGIMAFAIAIFAISLALSSVEIEAEGSCNSGFIGFDIEGENIVQNTTCMRQTYNSSTGEWRTEPDPMKRNLTCFREDLVLRRVGLKNIDGLNCRGQMRVKIPLIALLFGWDSDEE